MKKLMTMLLLMCSLTGLLQAKEDLAKNFVTPPVIVNPAEPAMVEDIVAVRQDLQD